MINLNRGWICNSKSSITPKINIGKAHNKNIMRNSYSGTSDVNDTKNKDKKIAIPPNLLVVFLWRFWGAI